MTNSSTIVGLATLLALASCGASSSGSSDLQTRIDTMTGCFPGVYAKFELLLDIADRWRLNTAANAADPTGLVWTEQAGGQIQIDYTVGTDRIDMQLNFFNAAGIQQDLDLSGATTISEVMDIAASALATGGAMPFLTADWSLRDPMNVIFGAGTFTVVVDGSASPVELLGLRTTLGSSTVSGGVPAGSDATLATDDGGLCTLRFTTSDLQLDTSTAQQYPIGTLTLNLASPTFDVDATVTFDQSNMATIAIVGVPTTLTLNLDNLTIN
jgi:hypothetical protein